MFKGTSSAKTKASASYFQKFGIEATIQTLVDVSNYTSDEIWLFSVELFAKEVTKFNMKIYAENKESEAEFEQIRKQHESKGR